VSDTVGSPVPDEDLRRGINVELAAGTLRRVGTVMQYVGGLGVVVWAVATYSTWDTLQGQEFSGGGTLRELAVVLGPFGTLLLAALVIGLGSACRLLADWTALCLADEGSEGNDEPLSDT
jgi:hypothetical protein